MTSTIKENPKLIHVACIQGMDGGIHYLFLRKTDSHRFAWFSGMDEQPTPVEGQNIEEAIRLAYRYWSFDAFRTLHCGFRYTLPERDEHGQEALFHQMTASYSSMNGVYYDEELGNNCFVQNASIEARNLWQRLKNRL